MMSLLGCLVITEGYIVAYLATNLQKESYTIDLQDVLAWIDQQDAQEPVTVTASGFQASRLDTLRTRTSAAYRGLYILLQREGARDFFWKSRVVDLDRDEIGIDIHHIFPRDWCRKHGVEDRVCNAIVNKTPISYKANRMIGGRAPSSYLDQIREHPHVDITFQKQDKILATHFIDPLALRADNFEGFYKARKQELLKLVEKATGKSSIASGSDEVVDDGSDDE